MAGSRTRKAEVVRRALARIRQQAGQPLGATTLRPPDPASGAFGSLEVRSNAPVVESRIEDDDTFSDGVPRTYSGLLDDVMLRYSEDYLGEAFFNKMIAKNVLFGGGMYLNDGYLVNHPVARKYLRNDDSLLRVMISNNFIRILTRKSDPVGLYDMPGEMARSGSTSFQKLIASSEWTDMQPLYKKIVREVFKNGNNRSWPAFDMSFGFRKLMGGIFNRLPHNLGLRLITEDQLKQIADKFNEWRPQDGNARDNFEKIVGQVVEENLPRKAEMMTIANQAYHYNFGLTLTQEETDGVAVDTTVGLAFDELLSTREVTRGQLEDFPLIQVPDNLPFDDGDLFRPFLQSSHRIGELKLAYLGALKLLLAPGATNVADLRKDARAATDEYLDGIKGLFRRKIGDLATQTIFSDSIVMGIGSLPDGNGSLGDEVAVTAAPTAGLAISLQSQAMARKREFLVERFRLVDAEAEFNPDRNKVLTLGDVRPQIASLAFNPARAREFIQDIPSFKV